jgi:hypothetical protein
MPHGGLLRQTRRRVESISQADGEKMKTYGSRFATLNLLVVVIVAGMAIGLYVGIAILMILGTWRP